MSGRPPAHPWEGLSALVDGELDAAERPAVERHLSECASCRDLLSDFSVVRRAQTEESPPPVPGNLRVRIRQAIDRERIRSAVDGATETPMPVPYRVLPHRLGLLAAGVLVLVLGLWALRPTPLHRMADTRTVAPVAQGPAEGSAATPSPPASPEVGDELKSLGYIQEAPSSGGHTAANAPEVLRHRNARPGGPPTKKTIAADEAPQPTVAQTFRDDTGLREAPAPVAAAPIGGGAKTEAREAVGAEAAPAAPATAQLPPAAAARRLVYEAPSYRIVLSEDGAATLVAGSYRCTTAPVDPATKMRVATLFEAATSPDRPGSETDAYGFARATAGSLRVEESRQGAARPERGLKRSAVPPAAAAEVEDGLQDLLREVYLPLMLRACGEPPQGVP